MVNDYELRQALLKVLHEHGVEVDAWDFSHPRPRFMEPRSARPRLVITIRGRTS